MKKTVMGLFMVSTLMLAACDTERETPVPDTYGEADGEENVVIETDADGNAISEDETGMSGEEPEDDMETDTDTTEEDGSVDEDPSSAVQGIDMENLLNMNMQGINWDDTHVTTDQFDSLLYDFQDELNQQYEEDNGPIAIDSIDHSDDIIEITITNSEDSDPESYTNMAFATFFDTFYRQLYLNSDYSDGTSQPHIIVENSEGEVITDMKGLLEMSE